MVDQATAGQPDVEQLAALLSGEHGVAGVGGHPLRAVDSGGVAELDVFGDVRRGQGDGVTVAPVSDDQ